MSDSALKFWEPLKIWKPTKSALALESIDNTCGTISASIPNGFGPPAIFMPEVLSSKSGLTRIATRARWPCCSACSSNRWTSLGDSALTVTLAATAAASSSSDLPGPAKLIVSGAVPVLSATTSSRRDATSSPSTSGAMSETSCGIGLAFIA